MLKNISFSLIFITILLFFYFVIFYYLSDKNKEKIYLNRSSINEILDKKLSDLPTLKNDTNNVIEFNFGFNEENKKKPKRNFWNLIRNK